MSDDNLAAPAPAPPAQPVNRDLAGLCVLLGLVCMALPFLGSWLAPGLFPPSLYLLSFSMAFGMFLTAVGGWVSGKWRGWTLGGAAATVVLLFTLLQGADGGPVPEKRMVAKVSAPELYTTVSAVEVVEDSGRRLYVAPNRELKHANVLIEMGNLDTPCLAFIFAPAGGNSGGEAEPVDVGVSTRYFRDIIAAAADPPHHDLVYSHSGRALLRSDPDSAEGFIPINLPGVCSSSDIAAVERRQAGLFGFIRAAFAGELDDQELIGLLVSPDALTRRDAREQIAARGPAIVPALMAAIPAEPEDPDHYRYALGAAVALARMADAGFPPEKIRAELSDGDVQRLAGLVAHPDSSMRRWATAAVVALEDERTVSPLLDLLAGETGSDGKYNAALALRQTAPNYDATVQQDLAEATRSLKSALSDPTSRLLEQLPAANGQLAETGWVFLGASYGKGWAERYFEWPDGSPAPPAAGSEIEAVESVDLRDAPATFSVEKGWSEPGIVGRVEKGQKVTVRSVEEVSSGVFWAEVEPGS